MIPAAASSTNPNAASGGFDPSGLISVGIGVLGNFIVSGNNAAAERAMKERLAALSIAQQKDLALKIAASKNETEKMRIVYEALAADKNRDAISLMNDKKYKGIIVLGIGFVILAGVIITVKVKNT